MKKNKKLAIIVSSSVLVIILAILSVVSFAGPTGPELACSPNTWIKRANFGGLGRQGPFGFSIGSKGYIGGGQVVDPATGQSYATADFWEYNSGNNTWIQKANYATSLTNPEGLPRAEATAFSIGAKGYVGTGFWIEKIGNNNYARDTKDFYEYNPMTNVWTKKADFKGTERNNAVGLSIGSKGYIGTGDFQKDFYEYNPATDVWTTKKELEGPGRDGAVAFSIGNKGYLGTGDLSPANNTVLKDFYEYNPATDTWTKKKDFGGQAYANGAGFAFNNKGYIQLQSDFQEYDPATDKWIPRAKFPLPNLSTEVGFAIGNNGYIGGGNNAGTLTKDFWMYCPGPIN